MIIYKVCARCEYELGVNEFHRDRSKKDGYRRNCIECNKYLDYRRHLDRKREQEQLRRDTEEMM